MRYPKYVLDVVAAQWLMKQKGLPYFKMGDHVDIQINSPDKPPRWVYGIFWRYSVGGMAYYYDCQTADMLLRKTKPENIRAYNK